MKTIAYLRVSTMSQDLDQQRLAVWDYAQTHQLTIDEFVSVSASSKKNQTARRLDELLTLLHPKDVLLVSELSRLGRSVGQIILLVEKLIAKQVRLIAIKEGIDLSGKANLQTKVMITLFSLFAEIERDLISERTGKPANSVPSLASLQGRACTSKSKR
jgi:DNA invertase Pin-like site-specific DNA recombinase